MHVLILARQLVEHVINLKLDYDVELPGAYDHVGALYTNVVLQSGLNYRTVVEPRVKRVKENYPEAYTVNGFILTIEKNSLEVVLAWKHSEKLQRMNYLLDFSVTNAINTCSDLLQYLSHQSNREKFLKLKGFGPKTLDYTLKLLDFDTIAVDRHIYSFLGEAGIPNTDYYETKLVVEYAADLLEVPRSRMDYAIWQHMSNRSQNTTPTAQGQLQFGSARE